MVSFSFLLMQRNLNKWTSIFVLKIIKKKKLYIHTALEDTWLSLHYGIWSPCSTYKSADWSSSSALYCRLHLHVGLKRMTHVYLSNCVASDVVLLCTELCAAGSCVWSRWKARWPCELSTASIHCLRWNFFLPMECK